MRLLALCIALALVPPTAPAQETGPRDCFWQTQGDPVLLNVAFPDLAARYWLSVFTLPPGAELELSGQYPHARYMSFNLYDEAAVPVDGLADLRIAPDAGSTNPFVVGARRDGAARDYRVRILPAAPPDARESNALYLTLDGAVTLAPITGSQTASPQGILLYRIYLPDEGRDLTGDVPLPQVAVKLPNGTRLEGPDACDLLGSTAPYAALEAIQSLPPPPIVQTTRGVTDPLTWQRFANLGASFGASVPEGSEAFVPPNGGFFSNKDNAYVLASWDTSLGEMISLIGRAPSVPDTVSGKAVMDAAQTRYWSLCQNDQLGGTRVISCAADYQVPVNRDGDYIAVISGPDKRPANATTDCGVIWLPAGPNPRGTVIVRNMLPESSFLQSVQAVTDYLDPVSSMRDYLPVGKHLSQAEFESLGCPVSSERYEAMLAAAGIERPAATAMEAAGNSASGAGNQGGAFGAVGIWMLVLLRRRRWLACCIAALGLSACGSSAPVGSSGDIDPLPLGELIEKQILSVTVTSPAQDTLSGSSTTPVPATVFIPEHRAGERYPLILHSHGWGGSRSKREGQDIYPTGTPLGYFLRIDAQIPKLLAKGYAVISFDERGWGDSTSEVKVMNPDYETRDAIAVLDWAEANLDLARDASGDPLVGSMGGSYGGGYQHNLAMLDSRIDTIIPGATWSSLHTSLAPNDVLKKSWTGVLCTAGNIATLGPEVTAACEAGFQDSTSRYSEDQPTEVIQYFKDNAWVGCSQPGGFRNHPCRQRPVDVLLVQGQRDVLFNLNEAAVAYDFYRALGGDVRLWTMQGGHINPGIQQPDGPITCGARDIFELYLRWFDAKLKHQGSLDDVAKVCLSLDDTAGATFDALPRGGPGTVSIPAAAARSVAAGRSVFVPIDSGPITESGLVLAGVPTVSDLQVGGGVAFIGVAIRKAGDLSDPTTTVDEQVIPFRAGLSPTAGALLVGIAEALAPGDTPGILLMSGHPQYEPVGAGGLGLNWLANTAMVSGRFDLPIVRPLAVP